MRINTQTLDDAEPLRLTFGHLMLFTKHARRQPANILTLRPQPSITEPTTQIRADTDVAQASRTNGRTAAAAGGAEVRAGTDDARGSGPCLGELVPRRGGSGEGRPLVVQVTIRMGHEACPGGERTGMGSMGWGRTEGLASEVRRFREPGRGRDVAV